MADKVSRGTRYNAILFDVLFLISVRGWVPQLSQGGDLEQLHYDRELYMEGGSVFG